MSEHRRPTEPTEATEATEATEERTVPVDASYPVHDDVDDVDDAVPAAADQSGGPDPVGLLAGVAALLVVALALTDRLSGVDPGWAVAGGAVVVGAAILLVLLLGPRRG